MRPRRAVVRFVFTTMATTVAGGCAVGPNYARPQMPVPAEHRFIQNTTQAASLADLTWWQVFDDATLQGLIKEALTNNLDVQAAVARVEEARAQAGIAKSFLYPRVDGVATFDVRQATDSSPTIIGDNDDTQHSRSYGFQLAWEIDLFGRVRRLHEAALARVLASEQGRRGVLVTLVGDVASNYFLLRELDLQLDIARRTLVINDATVEYFQTRLKGGVSNRLELDRIQANREETAATIPEIERQIAIVENAISMLLGRPPGPVPRPPLTTTEPVPPEIPTDVPANLLERRPDVVEAEQLLRASNADIGAAKALFFPSISLSGFLGGISGDLSNFLGSDGGVWSAGTSLLQPIFQGGRLRRNVEAARARFDFALADYRKSALNAYREVANALITIQKLAERRARREAGVIALLDATELSRARYDAGLSSYLEILTADEQLFQQQLLLAQIRGAELRARAELYRALGGGWQP